MFSTVGPLVQELYITVLIIVFKVCKACIVSHVLIELGTCDRTYLPPEDHGDVEVPKDKCLTSITLHFVFCIWE